MVICWVSSCFLLLLTSSTPRGDRISCGGKFVRLGNGSLLVYQLPYSGFDLTLPEFVERSGSYKSRCNWNYRNDTQYVLQTIKQLVISRFSSDLNGSEVYYNCKVPGSDSPDETSYKATLYFGAPPTIQFLHQRLNVRKGALLTICFEVSGKPSPSVTTSHWTLSESKTTVKFDESSGSKYCIALATATEEGYVYVAVTASNCFGTDLQLVKLPIDSEATGNPLQVTTSAASFPQNNTDIPRRSPSRESTFPVLVVGTSAAGGVVTIVAIIGLVLCCCLRCKGPRQENGAVVSKPPEAEEEIVYENNDYIYLRPKSLIEAAGKFSSQTTSLAATEMVPTIRTLYDETISPAYGMVSNSM